MEDLLTIREVARMVRVDDSTVRRWIATGVLAAVTLPHVGRRHVYRIRRSTIRDVLNAGELNTGGK